MSDIFIFKERNVKNLHGKSTWSSPSNIALIKYWGKKETDKEYIDNKSKNKSFSLSRKRFIPPHLYLGAKAFMSKF